MTDTESHVPLARRSVLGCAALLGLTGPLLVACSSGSRSDADSSGDGGGDTDGSGGGAQTPAAGDPLVAVADVPVGGGVALTDLKIVVTQPSEGEFKAFSGVCTHQGGVLNAVEDGAMICALHGSRFSVEDGSVQEGPASNPVAEIPVAVEGDQVVSA